MSRPSFRQMLPLLALLLVLPACVRTSLHEDVICDTRREPGRTAAGCGTFYAPREHGADRYTHPDGSRAGAALCVTPEYEQVDEPFVTDDGRCCFVVRATDPRWIAFCQD